MCELLGMSANTPTDICFSFSGLMQRGGETGPHKDGWGIAFYEGKGQRVFKEAHPSCQSHIANVVRDYPIKSKIVISHIRKANRGRVCLENTHPFVRELWGQNWTFAHNGQLKGIKQYKLKCYNPVGTTDSEHAFCWMLDQIKGKFKHPPAKTALKKFIQKLCDELASLGVFNILLSDSNYLFAYNSKKLYWITRKSPFGKANLVDAEMKVNFEKQTTPNDIVTIIASQPLTDNEPWNAMNKGELICLSEGVF